jgi:hypothetical protein
MARFARLPPELFRGDGPLRQKDGQSWSLTVLHPLTCYCKVTNTSITP